MRTDPLVARRRPAALAALTLAVALVAAMPAVAQTDGPDTEAHCVAMAVDVAADGRLVVSEPECFATTAEAAAATRSALAELASSRRSPGAVPAADSVGVEGALAVSKTLGIHYDGTGGTGSSITIVGSACTGGYWNASTTWKNRISSTYNGCGRLKHYDKPTMAGSTYTTFGAGTTDGLGWFADMTESVSYHAS